MKNIGTSEDNNIPETKRHGNSREGVSDETIYALKEMRYSNEAIADFYKKRGINISKYAIARRVAILYARRGEKAPRGRNKETLEDLEDRLQKLFSKKISSETIVSDFELLEKQLIEENKIRYEEGK